MADNGPAELVDVIVSLTAIMEEETGRLLTPGGHRDLRALGDAKARLVAALEARLTRLTREQPDWMTALDAESRAGFAGLIQGLTEASTANAHLLQRHIELSTEMMAAVAAEAQRLTGARNATYGERGALFRSEQATPISLNARF